MEWKIVHTTDDMPDHDCFVAYIEKDGRDNQLQSINEANLGGSVGFLSHSKKPGHRYCSIIEDGEILYVHDILMICEIPSPFDAIKK